MLPAFVLFPLAFLAAWIPTARVGEFRVAPWLVVYVLATGLAVAAGAVTPVGLAVLAILLGVAWAAHQAGGRQRFLLITLFAVLAVALSVQALPGVGKLTWPSSLQLSPQAAAFRPSLYVGRVSAGLLLFALLVPRVAGIADVRRLWRPTLAIGLAGTAATVGVALALGYVRFEPKLPPGTAVFLLCNLLFACIAEESFFRGLLQEAMHRYADRSGRRGLHVAAVAASALVFGAAHAGGGLHYVLLATLGGLTNALVYARARKVEASIFAHFLLNAVHFVFFTYPMLAR